MRLRTLIPALLLIALAAMRSTQRAQAQVPRPTTTAVVIENVRIFNGRAGQLSASSNVLIIDNVIKSISTGPVSAPTSAQVTRILGGGRTLMPGLIDNHTHMMMSTVPQLAILTNDIVYTTAIATKAATEMLMRGFTTARDVGGPVFGLKRAIDQGIVQGPRIWPAGATISQSGGHGDFRLPNELPARPGDHSFAERINATAIADGVDAVLLHTREQLALGASQIKVMAGGGVASNYDPLDATQYTLAEMHAAVEAARNWGTYVTVHAYTPDAVRKAIEAGVKCIEHGQLLDEATIKLMAEKGIWLSLQPFLEDQDMIPFAEGSANRAKQKQMLSGTDNAYRWAKKHKVKTAWGTDTLFDPKLASRQGAQLTKLTRWYTPAEVLKMATSDNADLLALSGLRSPYAGKLGVVQEGALADLLLVDGDPLANIGLLEEPEKNLLVIIKDGKIYKNRVP